MRAGRAGAILCAAALALAAGAPAAQPAPAAKDARVWRALVDEEQRRGRGPEPGADAAARQGSRGAPAGPGPSQGNTVMRPAALAVGIMLAGAVLLAAWFLRSRRFLPRRLAGRRPEPWSHRYVDEIERIWQSRLRKRPR